MADETRQTTAIVRRDDAVGGSELAPIVETNPSAMGALAEARVKARSVVALSRPRNMDLVRVRLLKECERPGFAAVARYALPRGGKTITGPSVRFAEAAARMLGNLDVFAEIIFDDPNKRIVQITACDLESNHSESFPVVVDKTMERRDLRAGEVALGMRTGSNGQTVYVVAVPESEMPMRQGAAIAKIRRNLILAHLPGDILEEALRTVKSTADSGDKADPDAARKKIADGFAEIGVLPDALAKYLGCDLAAASPAQIADLRAIWIGIRDGETTWKEIAGQGDDATSGKVASKLDEIKARLAEKSAGKAPKTPEAPASPQAAPAASPAPAQPANPPQAAAKATEALRAMDGKATLPGIATGGAEHGKRKPARVTVIGSDGVEIKGEVDPATGEVVPPPREPGAEG